MSDYTIKLKTYLTYRTAQWYDSKGDIAINVVVNVLDSHIILIGLFNTASYNLKYRSTCTTDNLKMLKGAAPATLIQILKDQADDRVIVACVVHKLYNCEKIHTGGYQGLINYYEKLGFHGATLEEKKLYNSETLYDKDIHIVVKLSELRNLINIKLEHIDILNNI